MKRFDVEMIRDFFDYLLWDVRASHAEQRHGGKVNAELVEQLKKYMLKYGPVVLFPIDIMHVGADEDPNEVKKRIGKFRSKKLEERNTQLRKLEAAAPIIEDVLTTINQQYEVADKENDNDRDAAD